MSSPPARALSSFVGRARELTALDEAMRRGGLVTVRGLGGMGKTRLAVEYFRGVDDVVWLDLAATGEPGEVEAMLYDAVGARADRPHDLARSLEGVRILVLDNVEQLVGPELLDVLGGIATIAPRLTLVATSRQRLGVAGERIVEVPPLPLADGIALFRDRLAQAPAPDQEPTLAKIVAGVEGIPLAVELVAARAEVFSLAQLAQRLARRRLDLIGGPGPGRHGSLEAVLMDSWIQLSDEEQDAMVILSVFADSFCLESAEAALGGVRPLDRLQALVGHSLVHRRAGLPDAPRFALLETVRAFVLRCRPDGDPVRRRAEARHAAWFADPERGWSWGDARDRIRADRANLEAALDRSEDRAARLRLAAVLWPIWHSTSPDPRLSTRLDAVLEPTRTLLATPAAVELLRRRAVVHLHLRRPDAALADAALAETLARDIDDVMLRLSMIGLRVDLFEHTGQRDAAREALHRLAGLAEAEGLPAAVQQARAYAAALLAADPAFVPEALAQLQACAAAVTDAPLDARVFVAARLARVWMDHPVPPPVAVLIAFLETAIAQARELGQPVTLGGLIARRVQLGITYDCLDPAWRSALEWDRPTGLDQGGYGELVRGILALTEGRGEAARALLRSALTSDLRSEWTSRCHVTAQFGLAVVLAEIGEIEAAGVVRRQAETGSKDHPLWCTPAARAVGASVDALVRGALDAVDVDEIGPAGLHGLVAVGVRASLGRRRAIARAWQVASNGAWFTPPDGPRVGLSHRKSQARILAHLARLSASGIPRPSPIEELSGVGWPDRIVAPTSAANRVHVALSGLRKAGLSLLQRAGGGYRLDPEVVVAIAPPD